MKQMSHNFELIYNLYNAAVWHKENCIRECNVSLFQLKQAAKQLTSGLRDSEITEINELLIIWPN